MRARMGGHDVTLVSFQDVFEWFAAREGQRAYIEVGQADPQGDQQATAIRLHATLGAVDADAATHDRRLVWVRLSTDGERAGLHLDEARFSGAVIHPSGVLKVWQQDVYIGVSVGEPRPPRPERKDPALRDD
jgi:hypothetical protein